MYAKRLSTAESVLDFCAGDYNMMRAVLATMTWKHLFSIFSSLEDKVYFFYSVLQNLIYKCIPHKNIQQKNIRPPSVL